MSNARIKKKQTGKQSLLEEELKTESPISEKDEVKAAEQRTSKLNKKAAQQKGK